MGIEHLQTKAISVNQEELKQVILVNGWLDMPVGKIAAQVSHASMAFLTNWIREGVVVYTDTHGIDPKYSTSFRGGSETFELDYSYIEEVQPWLTGSFGKLVLVVRSQEELEQVMERVAKNFMEEGEDFFSIIDAGRTVFDGVPTHTCTGFKPLPQKTINKLFGSLPLLK